MTVQEGGAGIINCGGVETLSFLVKFLSLSLPPSSGGYINVDDILELREARKNGYSVSDVQRIVANCPKQRFSLRSTPSDDDDDGKLQICANQGHSLEVHIIKNMHC